MDAVDGAVSVTAMPASGSKFPLGSTTVSLTASDSKGNTATDSFLITVVDTTAPDITVPDDITVEATGPSGAVVTFNPTAWDLVDEAVEVIAAPISGSTFPLGTTTVTVSATYAAGNSASKTFTVTVEDTTPPDITVPEDMTVEATGPSGAVVTFNPTAWDLVDEAVEVIAAPISGSTFPLGTTTVDLTATDAAGNKAAAAFTVTVVDTTPPELTVPGNITVNAVSSAGALVQYDPATAFDLVDQDVEITYSQNSGTWFPLGTTTVVVTAKDDYGNTATGSFTVTVKYDFKGFFQPVDMSKVNIAKAGSAIPIKFSLGGDMGLNIVAEGYPKVLTFIVDTDADTDIIETTVTAGASKLTYDPIADQYIYVWKTDKSWSGTGKKLIVVLQDGTSHEAKFQFRK
ncbi:MAG: HYR domain-containing protein [Clostridiaceae bacterium]